MLLCERNRLIVEWTRKGMDFIVPELMRYKGIMKKSEISFNEMTMFTFCCAILLRGRRARDMMVNAALLEMIMKQLILSTPIRLHGNNFSVKLRFDSMVELNEYVKNITFPL